MIAERKGIATGKVFGQAAKDEGFKGSGGTRFIEYSDYWLLINHQKSAYSPYFYINVGLFYKEILVRPLSDDDVKSAFKSSAPVWPHVSFRVENCPGMPDNLVNLIDRCVEQDESDKLAELIRDTLLRLLSFMEKNHDRHIIRKLNDAKKFPAMLLKEV